MKFYIRHSAQGARIVAAAVIVVGFLSGIGTVHAQITILSRLSHDRTANADSRYTGAVQVRNDTNEPQQVKVYPSDYEFFADGTNAFPEPGSSERSNANWIRYSPGTLILPPGETLPVQYEVVVPASSGCGVHWSVLFVESIGKDSPDYLLDDAIETSLRTRSRSRYGVQIATHVAGPCSDRLEFERVSVASSDDGSRTLDVDLVNSGETLLRPDFMVELYDEAGRLAEQVEGTPYRIYPGTSVRQRIDITSLPSGRYSALLVADPGDADLFGTQVSLEL